MPPNWMVKLGGYFDPFIYVMVMGTGISSNLLYSFPYEGYWLKRCSYPMFALACLIFLYAHVIQLIHIYFHVKRYSLKRYFDDYFRDLRRNVFWGAYPMGFATIINYIATLAVEHVTDMTVAKRMMRLCYIFWWYDVFISFLCAWGISFIIWQKYYHPEVADDEKDVNEKLARENLNTTLMLLIIPLVVISSSSGLFTMTEAFSEAFNRNIQLLTMMITMLMWLHSVIFVFIFISIFFWSLYVNKIPPMPKVFTMFLLLGPMGQASFGIMLLTEDIRLYTEKYYPRTGLITEYDVLVIAVPWCFKVIGLLLSLSLLAMGYFFTVIGIFTVATHRKTKINIMDGDKRKVQRLYHFHKGWFSMTFPMGTMSLGSSHVYAFYGGVVPLSAFRVVGAMYAVVCILWCIVCLACTFWFSILPILRGLITKLRNRKPSFTGSNAPSDNIMVSEQFSGCTFQD